MSAEATKSPAPESPTTARPLEMDDDDVQDTTLNTEEAASKAEPKTEAKTESKSEPSPAAATEAASPSASAAGATATTATSAPAKAEVAPPKPPRPVTEQQTNEQTLKEAFPTVEMPVIRAVLTASRGNIESAFHALLEMTDPDAVEPEPTPPAQPPRPVAEPVLPDVPAGRLSPHSQMVADERLARQLAQHYEREEGAYEARTSGYGPSRRSGDGPVYPPRPKQYSGLKPNEMWGDKEHSFVDDDLPVIRENLRKGFVETQTKFNNWFTGIKKRIDDEWNAVNDDDDNEHIDHTGQYGRPGGGRGGYGYYGDSSRHSRPSGDYDADPEVLSGDFAGIQLHGDGTPVKSSNPNLFRPPPPSSSPRPGSERKVAFREGGDDVIDMYKASPKLSTANKDATSASTPGSATKTSKWQPLSSIDAVPAGDSDPFSLGDSEDEKDNSKTTKTGGGITLTDKTAETSAPSDTAATTAAKTSSSSATPDDAERLRKAAAEAMADSLVDDKPKA